MLTPYDLDNLYVAENCRKIKVDDLVSKAIKELKTKLLEAQVATLGVDVAFTTSKTKFNGERIWFTCPKCQKRVGILYEHPINGKIGCRVCLNLKYRRQRFKDAPNSSI